jgi:uncharacterized protein with LGFP repeats
MSQIDHVLWSSVVPDLVLNPAAAIYQLWRGYRDEGQYLGVPLSAEIAVSDTEVQQIFSSGACIAWNPVDGARLV